MNKSTISNPLKHLRTSDIRGAVQLATQATLGVARMAEGVHQSVWRTLGAPAGKVNGQTRGITGMVYKGVRGATRLLGKGADTLLASLAPLLEAADHGKPDTPQRDAALAVLNGVMGDRLEASHNPFAIPMSFRFQGQRLDPQAWPAGFVPTGKVLLLIHGLCMNEAGWHVEADGQVTDHGQALAMLASLIQYFM